MILVYKKCKINVENNDNLVIYILFSKVIDMI
jgi:hypothetical protein